MHQSSPEMQFGSMDKFNYLIKDAFIGWKGSKHNNQTDTQEKRYFGGYLTE